MAYMYRHRLDAKRHRAFLAENRKDPLTRELLRAGDQIVICAECKSAWLADSWRLNNEHCTCGCFGTSREMPTLQFRKRRIRLGRRRSKIRTVSVIVSIAIIAIVGLITSLKGSEHVSQPENSQRPFEENLATIVEEKNIAEEHFHEVETRVVALCSRVNLRKKPTPNSSVITSLKCGTQVEVFGQAPSLKDPRYKWYHVQTEGGTEGWMFAGKHDTWLQHQNL